MKSIDYVGFFMDFNIYKITEDNNNGVSYEARECTCGDTEYIEAYLECLITKIIIKQYHENIAHHSFIDGFILSKLK